MKKSKVLSLSLVCALALSGATIAYAATSTHTEGKEAQPQDTINMTALSEDKAGQFIEVSELKEVEMNQLDELVKELEASGVDVKVEDILNCEESYAAEEITATSIEDKDIAESVVDITEMKEIEIDQLEELMKELEASGVDVNQIDIMDCEDSYAAEEIIK